MPAERIGNHARQRLRIALAICCTTLFASTAACAGQLTADEPQGRKTSSENAEAGRGSEHSATLAFTYNSDVNGAFEDGERHGAVYLQRIGLIGDTDLERVAGWRGAKAHISLHLISGSGLSGQIGTLLPVSGIEAEPAERLFNLWIEQRLGGRTTLRIGQFTAAQEFAVSPTAGLFINSTFGWPASFAADLPSGGPAYPLAAPGLRLAMPLSGRTVFRAAVFAGDPAGPGGGDPQRRDRSGLNSLSVEGHPFLIAEFVQSATGSDPAWTATLGGWLHTGSFDDLERDDHGERPAAPGSTGNPLRHRGNDNLYAMFDARLWRSGPRTLRGFVRATAGPATVNPIDRYIDAGLSLTSRLHSRPNDTFGVALAVARLSPRLRARRAEQVGIARLPRFEAVVEASWKFGLGPGFYLEPNAQLIVHPSAALVANPAVGAMPSHALVFGVRTSFSL